MKLMWLTTLCLLLAGDLDAATCARADLDDFFLFVDASGSRCETAATRLQPLLRNHAHLHSREEVDTITAVLADTLTNTTFVQANQPLRVTVRLTHLSGWNDLPFILSGLRNELFGRDEYTDATSDPDYTVILKLGSTPGDSVGVGDLTATLDLVDESSGTTEVSMLFY